MHLVNVFQGEIAMEEDFRRLVVGISGASGVIYGIRILEILNEIETVETHLILTIAANRQ